MTKHLAQSFVDLRGLRLTAQPITELCFDHAEGRFDIAALVIPLEKELAVEFIVVKKSPPEDILLFTSCVGRSVWSKSGFHVRVAVDLERNVRRGLMVHDLKVRHRRVGFVGADFLHHKASARRFHKGLEVFRIVRVTLGDFKRRKV